MLLACLQRERMKKTAGKWGRNPTKFEFFCIDFSQHARSQKECANTFEKQKKKDTHTRINSKIASVESERVKVNFVINSFIQLAFNEF